MSNYTSDTSVEVPESSTGPAPRVGLDYDQLTGRLAAWSLGLGLASIIAYQLLLLPLAASVLGLLAVGRNDPGRLTGKWRAWVGLILGTVYTLLAFVRLAT